MDPRYHGPAGTMHFAALIHSPAREVADGFLDHYEPRRAAQRLGLALAHAACAHRPKGAPACAACRALGRQLVRPVAEALFLAASGAHRSLATYRLRADEYERVGQAFELLESRVPESFDLTTTATLGDLA